LRAAGEAMVRLFERTLYRQDSEVRTGILARLRLLESALDITNYLGSILSVQLGLKQRIFEADDPEERVKLLTTVLRGELASLN
ncbi:MAG: hypothetical protein QGG90_11415, partial [Nitrospinota bacterium]|nr:hypothetical protein [Nitrospinota bacterium]